MTGYGLNAEKVRAVRARTCVEAYRGEAFPAYAALFGPIRPVPSVAPKSAVRGATSHEPHTGRALLSVEAEMRQVLAEMSVVGEAPATRHGDVVHGGERDRAPRGPNRSLAEEHHVAYVRASSPARQRDALREAREALVRARHAPNRRCIPGTLEWRIAIARAEGSVEQVSIVFGCSRATVYRLREQLSARQAK